MENNNKKIIASTIIAIITLMMLTIGAAYAYFTVSATNSFGTKIITATTPSIGSVALTTGSNLTMNLTAAQMMKQTSDVTYYASSSGTTTTETTETIGTAKVTGEGRYTCNYTLTIDDNSNSLYDAFQTMTGKTTGQIILTVNGEEYDFNSSGLFAKTISGKMTGLTSSESKNITAQLKVVNKRNVDQSALAGKTLTLTFNVTNFSCTAVEESPAAEYILANASEEDLWESTLKEDGYRYVGTNPDNYICFGTTNKNTCTSDTDKYMYRVIGIFEDNSGEQHLKLIKKEALNNPSVWHDSNVAITWANSALHRGLNGSYFMDDPTYSYMQNNNWSNKIEDWDYKLDPGGRWYSSSGTIREIYLRELSSSNNTLNTQISLMYISDYLLSLGSSVLNYTASNYQTIQNGWMFLNHNDTGAPSPNEWTMQYFGSTIGETADSYYYLAYAIYSEYFAVEEAVDSPHSVRPVFYLTSDVTISGEGTIESPFIII